MTENLFQKKLFLFKEIGKWLNMGLCIKIIFFLFFVISYDLQQWPFLKKMLKVLVKILYPNVSHSSPIGFNWYWVTKIIWKEFERSFQVFGFRYCH